MSGRAEQALADAAAFGISGFSPQRSNHQPHASEQSPASPDGVRGRAALEAASRAGISDVTTRASTVEPTSTRFEAILALGAQIGLAGFERRDDAGIFAAGRGAEDAFATATRLRLPGFGDTKTPAASSTAAQPAAPSRAAVQQAPSPATSQAAQSSKPVTKLPFAVVTIAAGGAAAFASLEAKMCRSFASSTAGKKHWLQRDLTDGTQTRAYPVASREEAALRELAGPLGSGSVRLSVGGIVRTDFRVHSSAGVLPPCARPSVAWVDAGVPVALRKALGR